MEKITSKLSELRSTHTNRELALIGSLTLLSIPAVMLVYNKVFSTKDKK